MRAQRNDAFCDLMAAAGFSPGKLAELLSHGRHGSTPTVIRTISRWRMGDNAPPGAVVLLLELHASWQ